MKPTFIMKRRPQFSKSVIPLNGMISKRFPAIFAVGAAACADRIVHLVHERLSALISNSYIAYGSSVRGSTKRLGEYGRAKELSSLEGPVMVQET